MHPNTPTFYIAGYNSSGNTTRQLQAHIPHLIELTYEVLQPAISLEQMAQQIQHAHKQTNATTINIIASSLGGWYAERLSAMLSGTQLHFILYNPSINAETNLVKYGLPPAVLEEYTTLKTQYPSAFSPHTRNVIVSVDDDVVSPQDNIAYYADHAELIQTTGGHRMTEGNLVLVIRNLG